MAKRGGARAGAGRKKGIGITYDIQKHCHNFILEILKDEAIKQKALKQLSLSLFDDNKKEYLYIIKNNGIYKIGYSSNFKRRYKNYLTHLGVFELVYLIQEKNAFELESNLHKMFENKKVRGEWFKLDDCDLINAISYCSKKLING